jgi:hypothetical protein
MGLPCFKKRESKGESETSPLLQQVNEDEDVGGGKDISFFGGLTLLTNSITGPGLVTLPVLMQRAGWFT